MPEKDENLEDIFGLEPLPVSEIVVYDAPTEAAESYDIEAARQNIHHLLQKGTVALDELLNVARQGQSVGGFDAVTKMLTALANINKDLIVVQEKKKQLRIADDIKTKDKETKNITNNLFVGTTDDLDKIIEMKRNSE